MKQHLTILIMLCAIIGGCTRNDGDIGVWFGTWVVESITRDDVPLEDYDGDIVMMFQSSVLETKVVDPFGDIWGRFATWHEDGNVMIIDAAPDETGMKGLVGGLELPEEDGLRLEIVESTSRNAVLQWTSPDDGRRMTYILRKHL